MTNEPAIFMNSTHYIGQQIVTVNSTTSRFNCSLLESDGTVKPVMDIQVVCKDVPDLAANIEYDFNGLYFVNPLNTIEQVAYITVNVTVEYPLELTCKAEDYHCAISGTDVLNRFRLTFTPLFGDYLMMDIISVTIYTLNNPMSSTGLTLNSKNSTYITEDDVLFDPTNSTISVSYGDATIFSQVRLKMTLSSQSDIVMAVINLKGSYNSGLPSTTNILMPLASDAPLYTYFLNFPIPKVTTTYTLSYIVKGWGIISKEVKYVIKNTVNQNTLLAPKLSLDPFVTPTTSSVNTRLSIKRNAFTHLSNGIEYNHIFPLGFGEGSLDSYNYTRSIPYPNEQKTIYSSIIYENGTYPGANDLPTRPPGQSADTTPPYFISLVIDSNGLYNFTYTVMAGDALSGVYSITIKEDNDPTNERTVVLKQAQVVNGTINQGTFQVTKYLQGVHHSARLTVTIVDRVGLIYTIKSGGFSSNSFEILEEFPLLLTSKWNIANITNVSFRNNTMDTSSYSVDNYNNTMYIKLTNPLPGIEPKVVFNLLPNMEINRRRYTRFGKWNQILGAYEVKFSLPANIVNGIVQFDIFGDSIITHNHLSAYNLFGNGVLTAISSLQDCTPPTITRIYADTDVTVSQSLSIPVSIDLFSHRNESYIKQHLSGNITFQGEFDPILRTIEFGPQDYDATTNKILVNLDIHYPSTPETNPPTLLKFKITDSVDLSSSDPDLRMVVVSFTVDDDSGYPAKNIPSVYMMSLMGDQLLARVVEVNPAQVDNKTYIAYFENIPYGWGSSDLFLSIYGLVDAYEPPVNPLEPTSNNTNNFITSIISVAQLLEKDANGLAIKTFNFDNDTVWTLNST
eukprot:gene16082-19134_t